MKEGILKHDRNQGRSRLATSVSSYFARGTQAVEAAVRESADYDDPRMGIIVAVISRGSKHR